MKQNRKKSSLTEPQMEIMNFIWDKQKVTVADVCNAFSEKRGWARTTIATMLSRLEQKGWLKRDKNESVVTYSSCKERSKVMESTLSRIVNTVFKGSPSGLVRALLENYDLPEEESRRIREMIKNKGKK